MKVPLSQFIPSQPSSHTHWKLLSQYPLTHPGSLIHLSQCWPVLKFKDTRSSCRWLRYLTINSKWLVNWFTLILCRDELTNQYYSHKCTDSSNSRLRTFGYLYYNLVQCTFSFHLAILVSIEYDPFHHKNNVDLPIWRGKRSKKNRT